MKLKIILIDATTKQEIEVLRYHNNNIDNPFLYLKLKKVKVHDKKYWIYETYMEYDQQNNEILTLLVTPA